MRVGHALQERIGVRGEADFFADDYRLLRATAVGLSKWKGFDVSCNRVDHQRREASGAKELRRVIGEDEVVIFDSLVASEATLKHRCVGGCAAVKVTVPPPARPGVFF